MKPSDPPRILSRRIPVVLLLVVISVALGLTDAASNSDASTPAERQSAAPHSAPSHAGPAERSNPAPASDASVAGLIPAGVLAKIPRRARNLGGQPEDLVNVLILGSEQDVKQTFEAAGWVAVSDAGKAPAVSLSAVQGLSKEAYLVRPLRGLYLFGRTQDYGYAHSEFIADVQARDYVRLWKNPAIVNGRTLWIGAAAHDAGPWWNPVTAEVSYNVDPDVDGERDLVRDSLHSTGLVTRLGYIRFFNKAQQVSAQGGSPLRTDGRVLVMTLEHLP